MSNPNLELSDQIRTLFNLKEGEFDPEVHLPLVTTIIEECRPKMKSYFGLIFHRQNTGKVFIEPGTEREGQFLVNSYRDLIPFMRSQINIRLWQANMMYSPGGELAELGIEHYKGKILCVTKRVKTDVYLPALRLIMRSNEDQWTFQPTSEK